MSQFSRCLAITLAHEGGWSDHAADPGGATMKGVTQARYAAYKGRGVSKDELRRISMVEVEDIYRTGYWSPVRGDKLPMGLDLALFDYAVNSGPARAVKEIQRIVGVAADGIMGLLTLQAIGRFGTISLIQELCDARMRFLRSLRHWSTFGKGWTRRVEDIRKRALAMATGRPGNGSITEQEPTGRADPRDVKPMAKKGARAKATAAAGSAGAAVTEAAQQLSPFADSLEVIKWLFLALTLIGVGLLVWKAFAGKDED